MRNEDIIEWLSNWYLSNCNGDWEHSYGITIETLDNPGFSVEIDLSETPFSELVYEYTIIENSETDWLSYKIENSVYYGCGDPLKLKDIIHKFKNIIEKNQAK